MNKPQLFVKSACLATQGKIDARELACGKFQSNIASDNFLFYLIELNFSYPNSKVIKKITQIVENNCKSNEDNISEEIFEKILQNINEGLGRLAESGENAWLGNLNAIIGLINGKDLLMAQTGNITGYIFRKNKISSINERDSTSASFHPLKTFIDITTGQLSSDDRLIFGNTDLLSRISLDRVRAIIMSNDYQAEALGLYNYLRKSKAFDVNAVFISASETETKISDNEFKETLFIDAPDETVKKILEKVVIPTYKVIATAIASSCKFIFHHSKKALSKSHKYWKENLGPKSKGIISTGSKSLADNLSKIKTKFPEIQDLSSSRNLSHIKMKTNSYLDPKKSGKIAPILNIIWQYTKNLRFLFLKKNRKYLYVILILVFVSFGYAKLKQNNDSRSQKAKEVQLLNSYDKAIGDFDKIKEDVALGKEVSNEKIYEVLATAERAKEIPANEEKAGKLIKEIKLLVDEKTKTIRFYSDKPSNFAENIASVSLLGNVVYSITTEGKIYSLDTREKSSNMVASLNKDSGTPIATSISGQGNKLLITTADKRIFAMDISSKTIEESKINADPNTWSQSNAIAAYSSNIYLLASDNGVVWKHTAKEGGYSKGLSYVDTKKVSILGSVDFAVDGNIYVLTNEGTVIKFVKGSPESDFSIKNIPLPNNKILIPKKIFTDEDTNSLFVLDKKLDRIIKFDKSGDFSNQYLLDGKPIDNFVVNAKLQKIWILSQGKIYEGNL
jgi:hypothetical protein